MTSSYTANLAAFLTAEKSGPTIESAKDLTDQTKIKYGCMEGGSTQSFFRESTFPLYQKMWTQMSQSQPSVFADSNPDGVKRVQTSKNSLYAFLMESTQLEYETMTKCDLKQVGQNLDSKFYAIAMPMGEIFQFFHLVFFYFLNDMGWHLTFLKLTAVVSQVINLASNEMK